MYLIGIFASPIPYLAILGIYLSGFAYIKLWPAQLEEDLPGESVIEKAASVSSLDEKCEVTLLLTDFQEVHALPPNESALPFIDLSPERYPFLHLVCCFLIWPSQHRVRPPPVG